MNGITKALFVVAIKHQCSRVKNISGKLKIGIVSLALLAIALIFASQSGKARKSLAYGASAVQGDDLRNLLLDQPDFTGEESERFSEEHVIKELRGFITTYNVAKIGVTYRRERALVISHERPNESALLLYPRSREYVESPSLGIWFEKAASPSLLAAEQGKNLVYVNLGDEELDGHRCMRIQVSTINRSDKDVEPTRVVYYLAKDLRNLVIRTDVVDFLGTTTYIVRNISFAVNKELFRTPSDYRRSSADPTAEYRLLDHFQLADLGLVEPNSFRSALLKKLPLGTPENQIYSYLEERLVGKNRLSSIYPAERAVQSERALQIVCRIEYDPSLPGVVKKHFAVAFLLDDERKLKDVRLNSWVSAP